MKNLRITQNKTQDLTFLTKLAEQYGYIFKIAENNLVFYSVRQLKDAKAIQILYKTDFSMLSFREKTSQRYKSVEVSYFDPKKKKTLKATARNEKVEKGDILKITARCSDKKQAIIKAKAALGTADTKIEGYFEIVGNPNLVAGGNVEIKGIGHFSGKYHITRLTPIMHIQKRNSMFINCSTFGFHHQIVKNFFINILFLNTIQHFLNTL